MEKEALGVVVYCRTAACARGLEGRALKSQRARCVARATAKGYKVLETFSDVGLGLQVERPGMSAMLEFLKSSGQSGLPVFVDDIARLARSIPAMIELSAAIGEAGGSLDMPGIELESALMAYAETLELKQRGA